MVGKPRKAVKDNPDPVHFTVDCKVVSKAHSRRLLRPGGSKHGKPVFAKSVDALSMVETFRLQCPRLDPLLQGDLHMQAVIYYPSRRSDLDESLIMDAMQGLIYVNDRQVRMKTILGKVDSQRPRVEITVIPMVDYDDT